MYGALLGVAGGGLGAIGAQQQRHALSRANRDYENDLEGYYNREKSTNQDLKRQYEGVNDRRLNQIGSTLGEYMAPSYAHQPGDTSTIDAALAQFHSGANPGAGGTGAAAGWGANVAARTNAATGRQRGIAGDASMLRRIGDQQSGALDEMGLADQRFGREVGNIQDTEQVRRANLAQILNRINMQGQKRFDKAGRAGSDWMSVGGMLGAGGQAIDGWNATAQPSLTQQELGYDPDQQNRGSRILSYSFNR